MEATTDAPTPNIRPMPVVIMNKGAVMLTAAKASLPIPLPTNIPSVMTNTAENTIPTTVGNSNLLKSVEMFGFSKINAVFHLFSLYLIALQN